MAPSRSQYQQHHKRSSSGSLAAMTGGASPSSSALASSSANPQWGARNRMVSTSSIRSHQTATEDLRPAHLDTSALSASEYDVYPQWLQTIKPARSGEPDHVEEQDALRFLREECGIQVHDEIKVSLSSALNCSANGLDY